MEENEVKHFKRIILGGTLSIGLGLLIQFFDQSAWFNIIFRVEKAISSRDSGHLILASAQMSFLYSVQTTFLFLGSILIIYYTGISLKFNKYKVIMVSLLAIIFFNVSISLILDIPWEPVTTILSLVVVMAILERFFRERNSFLHLSIVSIQVFYAFQWLNIMPLFSGYWIGQTDIPYSIKISGIYLNAASVLNFAGFAFFIPFIFSAFITTTLFISNRNNINIMRENYEKESKIQSMNAKILENRISNEVNSLVHDLKTPLVTIRGLNSLLAITVDHGKVKEYSGRIENSANKMNEMISSFLYDTSRQRLKAAELINYIRAQLPLEDDSIFIEIKISEKLPDLFVNKVRVARAVINILENAIIVPCKESNKHIIFEVKPVDYGLHIIVQDNGTGIKESDLTKIFEVGYSTNNTSGLGLSFAKQIIEDNKGSIEILSKHNEGTCVTIFLPKFYSDSDEVSDVN